MQLAIVTGASSGIGQATVRLLLERGWSVIGLSRRPTAIDDPHFRSISVDLTCSDALRETLAGLEMPQAIIHAAGIMAAAPLGKLESDIGQQLWALHVQAAETVMNHFAPQMQAGGRLVVVGSRTSRGAANRSQYVATKAALVGMVRSWAMELASRGITANVVAPGATATPMLTQPGRAASAPIMPPIGRLIQPQEVAALIAFLLQPEAGAITGQEIAICGGASLGK